MHQGCNFVPGGCSTLFLDDYSGQFDEFFGAAAKDAFRGPAASNRMLDAQACWPFFIGKRLRNR